MIHLERLHIVTDAALDEAQARRWGHGLMREVQAALHARSSSSPELRVRELRVTVPRAAMADADAPRRCARSVAQRILEHTPE
jgi:hypothetical protein